MHLTGDDMVGLILAVGIVLIPSLGLTARFALKPIVESMFRIRESLDRGRATEDPRLAALESRVSAMQETLDRVAQGVEFDRQLRSTPPLPAIAPLPATGPRLVRPAAAQPPAEGQATAQLHPADYEEEYL